MEESNRMFVRPLERGLDLEMVATQGWALNIREPPIRDSFGRTVAAINVSTPVGRTTAKEPREVLVRNSSRPPSG